MDTPKNGAPLDGLNFLEQLDAAIDGQKPSSEAHGDQANLARFGAELKVLLDASEGTAPQNAPESLRKRLRLEEKKPASSVVKLDRKLARFRLGILDIAALLAVSVLGVLIWNALKVPSPVSKGDPQPVPVKNTFEAEDGKAPTKNEKEEGEKVPSVVAKVLAVRPEKGLVMLSVGDNQGVKPGDRFAVALGDNKTTIVVIDRVYPDMSSAKAVIAQGDINVGQAATLTEPWKADIRRKLSRKVSFEFVNMPLEEAIAFIRSLSEVNLVIDPRVAANDKLKTPITLRVQDMDTETALNWILRLAELECDLRNQAVFITDNKITQEAPELRIYDVSDLPVSPEFLDTLLRMEWHPGFKFDTDKVSMEVAKGKLVVLQTAASHDVLNRTLRNIRNGLAQGQIELMPAQPDAEWKKNIRQNLQRKVTFEFVDTPLEEAMAFIRSLANVTLIVDPKVVVAGPPSINLRVTDIRLDLALEWILRLADLQYDLRDNAIFVGKALHPNLTTVAYKAEQFAATVKLDGPVTPEKLAQALRAKFPQMWDGPRTIKIVDGWLLICQNTSIQYAILDWLNGKQPADGPK